ncbi:Stp1/IreP family PP2C-type Ser/Thr phosphatase [Enterorhabdus sp. P55]|uniref:Stp1/IreP family PP2C-type Ser/Thr phosphatase n=1 Tax=Enterorhabdus sp. P55 TaxID=2304571 RepID=UPI00136C1EA7|nr:Stp1/IreP family PP2C-type Ser/Thr phosphatase [Enterorhabdus sp. P55]NBI31807.1 Stp1/IreP family PP2C-type Ser/Thr phosphatase [Enterorhabdus sp. P55]
MAARSFKKASSTFGSRTDVGCVREHNEDSLVVAPPLYVVCDGMGGHAAGEVASEIAVDVIAERAPRHPDAEALGRAVEEANLAIVRAAREGVGREGMGTTCTAAMLENERLVIAQVGDSRAYLLHKGRLQQLTRDHSLMTDLIEAGKITSEEARVHPQRSVITRALGSDPRTTPDLFEINVETGDRLLLCSDGLSGMVEDDEIESLMARTPDPQRCAALLVNEAIAHGGYDNVTVVVADVTGFAEARRRKVARKTKVTAALLVLLLAAIVAGAVGIFNFLTSNSAYLTDVDGKVAVYRGLQGDVFGLSTSKLVEVTDVSVDDLQPGLANRLRTDGIKADSVEGAQELVQDYRQEIEERNRPSGEVAEPGTGAADATTNPADANGTGTPADADPTADQAATPPAGEGA